MPVFQNGEFVFTIPATDLARGLRPSKRAPRNTKYLVECAGAVGYDQVLQVLSDVSENLVDTSELTVEFPYPQLFVFTNVIIVATDDTIYELIDGDLVEVYSGSKDLPWSAVDFHDFIYMSNGSAAVTRSATGGGWSSSSLPKFTAVCNFNGQVLIGSPE